jgi:chromate reductase, NAD(P)H dehydrogenase (quinone)
MELQMRKILLMAASTRKESYNKELINLIGKMANKQEIEVLKLNFNDFSLPLYDGNLEEKSGLPFAATMFIAEMKNSEGLILASPEYNFSIPGTIKNLIDWVSREKTMPWSKYPIMLCSASPSPVGGNRGLLHTATVLQSCCGAYVFPSMFSLANAHEVFTDDGSLKDNVLEQRLIKNITEFINFINSLKKI